MSAGTFYPAASGDDGYYTGTSWRITNADIGIGNQTTDLNAFVRFTNITIPKNATISSAYMRVYAYGGNGSVTVKINISAWDAADPAAPISIAEFTGAPKTAEVDWDSIPSWTDGVQYNSVDFASIIQALVDKADWASGNDLVLFFTKDAGCSANARRWFCSWNYTGQTRRPELHVEWTIENTTELEDASLDLSTYYQCLDDFASFLRAHDGLEYRDLQAALEAAGWGTEDLASFLSAYFQDLSDLGTDLSTWGTRYGNLKSFLAAFFIADDQDMKTVLETWATEYADLPAALETIATIYRDSQTWLSAYGQSLSSFAAALQAGAEKRRDLAAFFYATDGVVFNDFGCFFIAGDGLVQTDLGLGLRVVAGIPAFRAITAQKVSSVVHEVS